MSNLELFLWISGAFSLGTLLGPLLLLAYFTPGERALVRQIVTGRVKLGAKPTSPLAAADTENLAPKGQRPRTK